MRAVANVGRAACVSTSLLTVVSLALLTFASLAWASAGGATHAVSIPTAELPERAVGGALLEDGRPQVEARLLVSSGPERRAGVLFDLAPGWHLYWRNPGDTGIAPTLGIEAEGYRAGEVAWPSPRVFEEADGLFTSSSSSPLWAKS